MKILFISMPSTHVIRWIENLKDSGHELFWFDILDRGRLDSNLVQNQYVRWRKRKLPYITGEYFLSKKVPWLYNKIRLLLEVTENEALEKVIREIQPDLVHSFEMQSCSYPILKTMNKFPKLKWIYSCWGSDLYYYRNFKNHRYRIKSVLRRVDFLHTDCFRDFTLAKELGFEGKHLGVIPGGSGYRISELQILKKSPSERKTILVKGYEHKFGRGLNIIKALEKIVKEIESFEVVVFAAHQEVINYIDKKNLPFKFYDRNGLSHSEVLELMGKSLIYIGNSISDGISNTLLEAIVMGSFPIQSNPGGASAEIIQDGKNGLLINDPESVNEIVKLVNWALHSEEIVSEAFLMNVEISKGMLDYEMNSVKINELYNHLKE